MTATATNLPSPPPSFVPVQRITGVQTFMVTGSTITLQGNVQPSDATKKQIEWSFADPNDAMGYATLNGNQLTSTGGTHTVMLRATVRGGLGNGDYTEEFPIEIGYPVELVQPSGSDPSRPLSLKGAKAGQTYEEMFEAIGGQGAPYSFVLEGSLPEGLLLEAVQESNPSNNSKARITGIPKRSAVGNHRFTVQVSDKEQNKTSYACTLEVASGTNLIRGGFRMMQLPQPEETPEQTPQPTEQAPAPTQGTVVIPEGTPAPTQATTEPEGTPAPTQTTSEPEGTPAPTQATTEPEGTPAPTQTTTEPEGTPEPTQATTEPEGTPAPTQTTTEPEATPAPTQMQGGGEAGSKGTDSTPGTQTPVDTQQKQFADKPKESPPLPPPDGEKDGGQ